MQQGVHEVPLSPVCLDGADEELRTVSVGASVGHGQCAWTSMLQLEILILKLVPIYGLSSSAITASKVTTLYNV